MTALKVQVIEVLDSRTESHATLFNINKYQKSKAYTHYLINSGLDDLTDLYIQPGKKRAIAYITTGQGLRACYFNVIKIDGNSITLEPVSDKFSIGHVPINDAVMNRIFSIFLGSNTTEVRNPTVVKKELIYFDKNNVPVEIKAQGQEGPEKPYYVIFDYFWEYDRQQNQPHLSKSTDVGVLMTSDNFCAEFWTWAK